MESQQTITYIDSDETKQNDRTTDNTSIQILCNHVYPNASITLIWHIALVGIAGTTQLAPSH